MNNETYTKTQFNEIKQQLTTYAISSFGKQRIEALEPHSKLSVVEKRLSETEEAKKLLDSGLHVPFMGLQSAEHITNQLDKGFVLTPSELLEYADFLRSLRLIRQFFEKNQSIAPLLNRYGQGLNDFQEIEEEIYQVIRNGRVVDDASRELRRARRDIAETQDKIQELLKKFIRQNKEKMQEAIITKRNDVFTVPIKAAYKKQVKGTIVELSTKGTTAYIEPSNVSKWNEQLAYHKMLEEAEIYQILATLTGLIAEALPTIQQNIEIIAEFDHIFARGKFSRELKGITPKINNHGYIHLKAAKHPLLGENAVPLDLTIGSEYRGLTITGPNAGGKTVVLKTVALLSLMTMIGVQIPAQKGTEIAIFGQIFVDIGDAQSIENALSTFSGHMQNISNILRKTKKNSLILLDELGSGTEPNEGAALAIAIMEEFYQKGSILITTTHYGEIKRFAQQHPDFITAAMDFDAEHLTPKYRLLIGQTGESNALWIAKKMAISDQIIKKAEKYFVDRDYQLEKKTFKSKTIPSEAVQEKEITYYKGDKVFLLEQQKSGLVYQEIPFSENVSVYLEDHFIEVPKRRIKLEFRASELYPADYEVENLFEDFHKRKERRDIDRGSKKAQRKLRKEAEQRKKL